VKARRLPVADRVERDGESVVLVDRQVVRLSELATALLELCAEWATPHELAGGLLDRVGEPPAGVDPVVAVESALRALHDEGLVELA
jgi:hypothetical protein